MDPFPEIDLISIVNPPDGYESPIFSWNPERTSLNLVLKGDNLICQSKDGGGFRTALGTEIFREGGRYYFEVLINKGELIKIGVSRPNILALNEAFCDTMNGWAIYNGQTRHGSNSSGPNYGTQICAGDIIGVSVDMVQGKLYFSRNGTNWGVAFQDNQLQNGQLVAAVSLIYANDQITLRCLVKED